MVPRISLCTQTQEKNQSSLGAKGESVAPGSLLDAHAFSTPIREFLQIPKTTGEKRKETDSSPTEETLGKTMRTGTTEQWKKVVPKNGRRKASPKHKTGTVPFNPKPIGPSPINSEILNKSVEPKVPGTQGAIAPKGQNSPNLTNPLNKPPSAQKTTLESTTNSENPLKHREQQDQRFPKVPKTKILKTALPRPKLNFTMIWKERKTVGPANIEKRRQGLNTSL